MTNLFLSKALRASTGTSIILNRYYHAGRAGSVNTAIARGLRKSKGMGFRGKATPDPNDLREKYRVREGIPAYVPPEKVGESKPRLGRFDKGRDDRNSRAPMKLEGPLSIDGPERRGRYGEVLRGGTLRKMIYKEPSKSNDRRFKSRDSFEPSSQSRRPWDRSGKEETFGIQDYSSRTDRRPDARSRNTSPSSSSPSVKKAWDKSSDREQFAPRSRETYGGQDERRTSWNGTSSNSSTNHGDRYPTNREAPQKYDAQKSSLSQGEKSSNSNERPKSINSETPKPRITHQVDKRIPISIPYTTPASEFLYGTHLVEAALSSRKEPRRKLYKLYVLSDASREDPERDLAIIRLAQRGKVEIVRLDKSNTPMLDKMSGGRPHNGYILEASPLPKMPIQSLGAVGPYGFGVTVDHQSREEAAINGTEGFISVPVKSTGKNPLVLLLDSIVDPGNLGGILRTAAFLGVSAVAISTRNSASFTPVVLKASAGASENITLFEVKKPAGFLVDSQANGWKIFAAVAPSKDQHSMRTSMSTDDLEDPLSDSPCILMLGSEGEGLRWNLRSKADVDLYIESGGSAHNVDSLNVSVAAGILCNSFLSAKASTKVDIEDLKTLNPDSIELEPSDRASGQSETRIPGDRLF